MKLSPQAIILALVFSVLFVVNLVVTIWKKRFSPMTILSIFVSIMLYALIVYDTHCLTTGTCNVWSWIRTVLYSILPILLVVALIMSMVKNDSTESEQESNKFLQYLQ